MMMMTAKVNYRKLACMAGALVLAVFLGMLFLRGRSVRQTSAPVSGSNDSRVEFLKSFGWQVNPTPKESGSVRIPEKSSELFDRYNTLQISQGYNLSEYAGKKVLRYVYEIQNYPGATQPVYATVLVYKGKIVGGDITDTAAGGKVQGFQKPKEKLPEVTVTTEDALGFSEHILP